MVAPGYPTNWDTSSVIKIGIADNHQINKTKVSEFANINYTQAKTFFPTIYDYFVFFANDQDQVLNVNGICGIGSPLIQTSYNANIAYYYTDSNNDNLLPLMQNLGAQIFTTGQLNLLVSNISNYTTVVMEQAEISNADLTTHGTDIQNFVSTGGSFVVADSLTQNPGQNLFGANYLVGATQTTPYRNATINSSEEIFDLNVGENIVFRQNYYPQNTSESENFETIAAFNLDNSPTIAKWNFGNGSVYFTASVNHTNYNSNFTVQTQEAIQRIIQGTCDPINTSSLDIDNFVNVERYLSFNAEIVKMIVYVWK